MLLFREAKHFFAPGAIYTVASVIFERRDRQKTAKRRWPMVEIDFRRLLESDSFDNYIDFRISEIARERFRPLAKAVFEFGRPLESDFS